MNRRWRNLATRRGRYLPVPPATVAAAPAVPPRPAARRRALTAVVRRGRFLPVLALPQLPPRPVVRRRTTLPARRGEFFVVPYVVATAGPSPVPPAVARQARRPQLPVRRGEFLSVPYPLPAGPGPLTPRVLRQTRRLQLPTRRGEFATPVPAPQQPLTPSFIPRPARTGRARSLLIRRGEFLLVPAAPGVPPRIARPRRQLVITRRGEFFGPVPPPAVTAPAVWVPPRPRARRLVPPVRSGTFQPLPLVGATAPVVWVPAADPRLTIRPNRAGLTAAANHATAAIAPNQARLTITEEA